MSVMYLIGLPIAYIAIALQVVSGVTILLGAWFADIAVRKPNEEQP